MKYTENDLYIGMKFYRTDINSILIITDITEEQIMFKIVGNTMIHSYYTNNFLKFLKEIIPIYYVYEIY